MPLSDRLVGVAGEKTVLWVGADINPLCLEIEHEVRSFWWLRKIGIDRRGERMHKFGPARVPHPEKATAQSAEAALCRTLRYVTGFRFLDLCPIESDILASLYIERVELPAEVDRISSPARSLSTDGAVAEIERVGMGGFNPKPHLTTMTGTMEQHQSSSTKMKPGIEPNGPSPAAAAATHTSRGPPERCVGCMVFPLPNAQVL
jgi:hypothetical protein